MTKRVFELAREYGVDNKTIISKLKEHNIQVSNNLSGVDDSAKSFLDKELNAKVAAKKEGTSDKGRDTAKGSRNNQNSQGGQSSQSRQENHAGQSNQSSQGNQNRQGGQNGQNSQQRQSQPQRPQGNQSHQDNNRRRNNDNRGGQRNNNGNRPASHGQNQQGQNHQSQSHQGQGGQNQPRQGQGGQNQNGQGQNGQNRSQNNANGQRPRQHTRPEGQRPDNRPKTEGTATAKKDDGKRTKYFSKPSQGGERKDQHGQNNNRHDKKNTPNAKNGSRPHTLLSNVLNKGKGKNNRKNQRGQHGSRDFHEPMPEKKRPALPTTIQLDGPVTVKDLSEKMGREVSEIIKKLMMGGIMATINQELDLETATLLADEFGVTVEEVAPPEDPTEIEDREDAPETLKERPPVVTIMGHVDHGKTSLLDAIRSTHVTSHEAGGITQHIGAYQVRYGNRKITFMDTPGHEAFTAMRARGAQVTDIAVLVVAADDGVMPQTIESINHAKSAGVPIIVAINKIDKEGANPEQVKQQLTEYGLIGEDWGGETIMVPVSAHKKIGLEDLLENILVLAEVSDLKANPNRQARGVVIEAKLDKGRGPVASVLIQKGTLHVGDTVIAGTCYGNVRAMTNERGERLKKAEPSIPVEILGLNDVPEAGDILDAVDEKVARTVAEKRMEKKRSEELHQNQKVTLDDLFNQIQQGELKELSLVVKGDVQGSVEALSQSLQNIKSEEVRITIVHAGVGAITESDVMLASASNALIIGFNVRPDAAVRKMAEHENVDLRTYRVIYDAINDVEAAMKGMLERKYEEKILGRVQVRRVITTPKVIVAGSYVTEGKITNSAKIRLLRDGVVIHEGEIDSLRRFKDDVKEVAEGYECGISLEGYRDVKEGDEIEAYEMVEIAPQ